jgi:DNA-binding transcriptional LysR family regulator
MPMPATSSGWLANCTAPCAAPTRPTTPTSASPPASASACTQLPPFLRRFNARFPDTHLHLRYGLIDGVHHYVLENEAGLGLACYPRRRPGLMADLFRHERLLLVCHPEHPLVARPAVALKELQGQTFVARNEIRWSPFLNRIPDSRRHLFEPRHEFN